MTGQVLNGINNIYTVNIEGKEVQCRIKGKVLKEDKKSYNPIAVGDFVEVDEDPLSPAYGWITERKERKSTLQRWNKNKRAPQIIAANVDCVVCVASVVSPPFRPRFVDRILVTCEYEELLPLLVINKIDLGLDAEEEQRIAVYRELGYKVILCSAKTGKGISELLDAISGGLAVFCGQSGVGKSSLLNSIEPGLKLRIGEISAKHNRGSHTTCFSTMLQLAGGQLLIDTPGIRELFVYDMDPAQLRFHFIEFPPLAQACAFPACLHLDEPDCGVKQAVEQGQIHPDRYESYQRFYSGLLEMKQEEHG